MKKLATKTWLKRGGYIPVLVVGPCRRPIQAYKETFFELNW